MHFISKRKMMFIILLKRHINIILKVKHLDIGLKRAYWKKIFDIHLRNWGYIKQVMTCHFFLLNVVSL